MFHSPVSICSNRLISRFYVFVFSVLLFLPGLVASAESKVNQDYHLSLYKDVQGSVDALELFTKAPDKREFFGITCSMQSPMPLIQVILFDDEIMSETPKLLTVTLAIDGVILKQKLQGIIKVVDNADEFSNKIRLELVTQKGSSFKDLQNSYRVLLKQLQQGKAVTVQLEHRNLATKKVNFSLKGLGNLLVPNQNICF
ncbi:hypothetical protein [Thiomicrorhabdus sp. Milos-T2]|uniref:hypothetical protein n=1 Tax=Thiomicrorhabdus sp. Milos-T2 TaxID=90814 RepID=UPI00049419D8|nr:hypothetical protein [Thiomicrorhabdus sp. Milos-T2]